MSDRKFKTGDEVRLLEGRNKGSLVYLADINHDNPEDEYWAEASYNLTDALDGFGNVEIDSIDHVELVRKAKDIPQPKLPTSSELIAFLGSAVMDAWDGIDVNGTDRDSDNSLIFYGKSASGQPFSAMLQITSIEWADS